MSASSCALLVLDLQNDICHHEGIFAQHGLYTPQIKTIIPSICETILFCRKMHIPILATQLTVLQDLAKNAVGLNNLLKLRPFLEKKGLRKGTWGHDLLEGLPPVDYKIRKWNDNAFYQTELEHYLQALKIQELILCGFTTNGVVETVAREAIGKNYKIIALIDCTQSYSESLHQASLSNLAVFGQIFTSQQWQNSLAKEI